LTRQAGGRSEAPGALLEVVPAAAFHRLTEAEFGMPGLVAVESVGPFVRLARLGPFITIHDSFIDPGLGIGHHPHRGNERLFYILRGELRHDDALNGIQGVMEEGDLARLTEGRRGMIHQEWNGRDDVRAHAFILVYTPDAEPAIPFASFAALRAPDRVRTAEGDGAETLALIGGASSFGTSSSAVTLLLDSTLAPGAEIEAGVAPGEGLLLYPLEGSLAVAPPGMGVASLNAVSTVHPEGPDAMAVAWAGPEGRSLRIRAGEEGARLLRIGFVAGPEPVLLGKRRPAGA
jgi:redox-sensitive bicupin YhaK (pirin superfamily)